MKTNQKQKNIPEGWLSRKLGTDVSIFNGGAFSSEDSSLSGIKWLKIANVGVQKVNWATKSFLPKHFLELHKKYELKEGDIILALTRPTLGDKLKVAKIKESDTPALLNQRVGKLTFEGNLSKEFCYYFLTLDRVAYEINQLLAGTDPPNLSSNAFDFIKINTPIFPEQNRIVTVLETWDSGIEKLKQKIAIKKEIKKGLMQVLLTGKKRLPGSSDEWNEYTLQDIAEFKKGSGISKSKLIEEGKNPCLLYGEIYTKYDELILDVKSYTNTTEGVWSEEGDIFVPASTTTNALDLATATTLIKGKVLVGGDVNIMRNKKGLYDSVFMSYYLSHTIKRDIAKYAQGVTIIHLYGNHFKKEKVLIPSRKEQEAIVDIIKKSTKEILILEDKLKYLQEQKKYLLNNLITGQIRTPNNLQELITNNYA